MVKKLILDTTLTYYCLNVWGQMYFSIINEPHFECNKNLGRSYTCKVLGFLYQLMSKICIKSRKNSRKISGKAWVGERACNQTENLLFTIRNREIEKLDLGTCRPRGGVEPLQLLIQTCFFYNCFGQEQPNKVSLVFLKEAHTIKINLYQNFNENTKDQILAYSGGKKFQIV